MTASETHTEAKSFQRERRIYILGMGAVGLPLAAYLSNEGKRVVAVRTSKTELSGTGMTVTVHGSGATLKARVETALLSELEKLDGIVVVTAKSYANETMARMLSSKVTTGPLVILQNGIGVERPFLEVQFPEIYRCVLYMTSQVGDGGDVTFRQIAPSPIGVVNGSGAEVEECVNALATAQFQFRFEENIQREIWKKAIINSVFNSICPLLEVDNGAFARNEDAARLAREIVCECLVLAEAQRVSLTESEVMDQIMRISKGSEGVLISTLQDIRNGRKTEIEYLNLELARIASSMHPPIDLPKAGLLGRMVQAKSASQPRGPLASSV